MSAAEPGPEPGWGGREPPPRAFALTLCAAAQIDTALARAGPLLARHAPRGERRLAPNAQRLLLDCDAAAAWDLWQRLRAAVSDADIFLQPLPTLPVGLMICDMDMTIVAAETLDEVAAELGLGKRIAAITARAMHGELDFDAALRERIAMLAGQPEQTFHQVARRLPLNPGAAELVAGARAAGIYTILISGGFAQVAEPLAARLGFDEVVCNHLELERGRLTGGVLEPIVNAAFKRDRLEQRAAALGIELAACCAIGDGANDRPMIEAAGLGIAYRAKPVLRAATAYQINAAGLDAALHLVRPQPDDEAG